MKRSKIQPVSVSAVQKINPIRSSIGLKLQHCLLPLHCCTENKSIILDVKQQKHCNKSSVHALEIQTHTCTILSHQDRFTFILLDRLFNITAKVHHAFCLLPPCPLCPVLTSPSVISDGPAEVTSSRPPLSSTWPVTHCSATGNFSPPRCLCPHRDFAVSCSPTRG